MNRFMLKLTKGFRDLRYRLFYALLLDRRFNLVTLCAPGSICPWTIHPAGLIPKSIVYCGGIGSDISFEHELVKHFGCDIVLYDPSPTGAKTMALPENQIPQFHYFPVALTARKGKLKMTPPQPGEDSWFPRNDDSATIEVPCTDLQSLMQQNGHDHIDLLKMDIEGSEYEVIDDLLKRRLPIGQICVEFHHALLPGYRRSQTIRAILKLRAHGYKLVSQDGENHTFIFGSSA